MRKSTGWVIAPFGLGAMVIGVGVAGCGSRPSALGGDASTAHTPMLDAAAEAPIGAGANCFGTGIVQICVQASPTMPIRPRECRNRRDQRHELRRRRWRRLGGRNDRRLEREPRKQWR